jgi:hypothetical protein
MTLKYFSINIILLRFLGPVNLYKINKKKQLDHQWVGKLKELNS